MGSYFSNEPRKSLLRSILPGNLAGSSLTPAARLARLLCAQISLLRSVCPAFQLQISLLYHCWAVPLLVLSSAGPVPSIPHYRFSRSCSTLLYQTMYVDMHGS